VWSVNLSLTPSVIGADGVLTNLLTAEKDNFQIGLNMEKDSSLLL
jgi:hypothetical protein